MNKSLPWFLAVALFSSSVFAQSTPSPQSAIQGVWQVVEITATGANATRTKPPGLFIFTGKHYSITRVDGDAPRTAVADQAKATAEQLRDVLRFVALAGTYEITGGELVTRRIAALPVASMAAGNTATYSYKLEGNTLWITTKTNLGAPVASPITIQLRRVE